MKRVLPPLLTFFVLALALSWLFDKLLPPLTFAHFDLKLVLTGFGPALSGLVCYQIFKTPNANQISMLGHKPLIAGLIALLAIVLPVVWSTKGSKSVILATALTQFAYCIGEELGWRYYLQNATAQLGKWQQSLTIGIAWFFWHFSILSDPTTMLSGQKMPWFIGVPLLIGLLTLLSNLFGSMVLRTGSIVFPVALHYAGKVGNGSSALVILLIVSAAYILWEKLPDATRATPSRS